LFFDNRVGYRFKGYVTLNTYVFLYFS